MGSFRGGGPRRSRMSAKTIRFNTRRPHWTSLPSRRLPLKTATRRMLLRLRGLAFAYWSPSMLKIRGSMKTDDLDIYRLRTRFSCNRRGNCCCRRVGDTRCSIVRDTLPSTTSTGTVFILRVVSGLGHSTIDDAYGSGTRLFELR